ncbi:MAG: MCP four helix bundle domain-containing protein [Clostridiales bacterium]
MNWFYNLSIKFKFLLCFGILTIMINLCGYYGITGLKTMNEHSKDTYDKLLVPVSDLGQIATYFQNSRVDVRDMILYDDPVKVQELYGQINKRNEELNKQAEVFKSTILTDSVRQVYDDFEKAKSIYISELNKIMDLALKGDKKAATDGLFGSAYKTARANEQAAIEKLVSMKINFSRSYYQKDMDANDQTIYLLSILITFCTILAIVAWMFLGRSIARPIVLLERAAKSIGEGKFDVTLAHKAKDEIGKLVDTFKNMLSKIKDEIALTESLKKGFQIPFVIVDKNLKMAYYNDPAEKMFGYPASDVINKMDAKTLFGTDEATRGTIEGTALKDVRFDTHDRSGNNIPVLVTTGVIRNGNGEITSGFILLNDLRKDQEKQEKYLRKQTEALSEVLERLSKGDLTATVNMDKNSPLYSLGENLSSTIDSLRDVLSKVNEAVQATASAANEISSSSEQMAAGGQEQSQQTTEVACAIEQMTRTILESTQNASKASENSQLASKSAKE